MLFILFLRAFVDVATRVFSIPRVDENRGERCREAERWVIVDVYGEINAGFSAFSGALLIGTYELQINDTTQDNCDVEMAFVFIKG